jgi:hypothetical protein
VRRYFAAGIWLVLTITATFIVWTAVSVVAADVTDRPAPVVAHRDVIVALAGSNAPTTTTTATTVAPPPPRTTPTTTGSPATTAPATTVPSGLPGTPSGPVVTTTIPPPPTTKAPAHPVAPTTTVAPPVGGTATYSTDGGVVAVACTGFSTIRLVAALPNDGYQAVVISTGPTFVAVNFANGARNRLVGAACAFGVPFEYTKGSGPPPTG